jgi:ribosomal protein L7/L12
LNIASFIIIAALVVYIFTLHSKIRALEKQIKTTPLTENQQEALAIKVSAMLEKGYTNVEVIKAVRQDTGWGLLQAKQYVDTFKR